MGTIQKLERPERIAELSADATLARIGLKPTDVFCDIGAGSGLFTFAAANITKSVIYAVEISDEMLAVLHERTDKLGHKNIRILNDISDVPSDCCDRVLLSAVIHELDDAQAMAAQAGRICRQNGTLAVIEFHKKETPIGPPVSQRIDADTLCNMLREQGFTMADCFSLGANFYCALFGISE